MTDSEILRRHICTTLRGRICPCLSTAEAFGPGRLKEEEQNLREEARRGWQKEEKKKKKKERNQIRLGLGAKDGGSR